MTATTAVPKALAPEEGLRPQSGPGRDLVFKLTGEDTRGGLDYFTCDVAPHGGPPLHVHHRQDETRNDAARPAAQRGLTTHAAVGSVLG